MRAGPRPSSRGGSKSDPRAATAPAPQRLAGIDEGTGTRAHEGTRTRGHADTRTRGHEPPQPSVTTGTERLGRAAPARPTPPPLPAATRIGCPGGGRAGGPAQARPRAGLALLPRSPASAPRTYIKTEALSSGRRVRIEWCTREKGEGGFPGGVARARRQPVRVRFLPLKIRQSKRDYS